MLKITKFEIMNDQTKKAQLRKYKMFATGLFVAMAVIFVVTTILQKTNDSHWIGYVRAFAEAAMVGALADWFAVTALFNYPLGLRIPHTNLIENSKERIGDNLGSFVVDNFLSPQNIRPYIQQLKISHATGEWLAKERNQDMLVTELSHIVLDILQKLEDDAVVKFIEKKASEMTDDLKINTIVGNGIDYVLHKNDHQRIITGLSRQIKDYVLQNESLVKERVKSESYFLIPKFVDDAIADKITSGLSRYFEEVETDQDHSLRAEISRKIADFSREIQTEEKWEQEFRSLKNDFLNEDKLHRYSSDIWQSIKKSLTAELEDPESALKLYIRRNLAELADNLQRDPALQHKIDHWIRVTAYKYILKNTHHFGNLISATVGNWQGRELSRKLELEVGKDLQFIRVNGTLVGGLVGLVIYTIAHFFI